MRLSAVMNCVAFASMLISAGAARAEPDAVKITGPYLHENLAIYLVHGPSKPGPAPLTLAEALAQHLVLVRETGNVNSLEIENLGDEPIFVQAGDIVKGGRQDRTMAVSLLLPPKSGRVPIASFCVESGRWTARGHENAQAFASAAAAVPSRETKLAMQEPVAPPTTGTVAEPARTASAGTHMKQRKVWDSVHAMQNSLSAATGADVRAPASQSSLQLALENEKLAKKRDAYIAALAKAGDKDADVIGYVFAVNGAINSGDVYQSNALFKKMWAKMLAASAT